MNLEEQRQAFEDVECYERMIIAALEKKPKAHRERVKQGHRVSILLDKVAERSEVGLTLSADPDGSRKAEIQAIQGNAVFSSFYDRLRDLREYHRRFPHIQVQNQPDESADDLQPKVQFSGEEMYGKYLDLHQFYEKSCNMPQLERMEYIQYLRCFSEFGKIDSSKKNKAYLGYVTEMRKYLVGFYKRTQPLVDLDDILKETLEDFNKKWDTEYKNKAESGALDLDSFTDTKQLEALGLERLKMALMARNLKCGGTLPQRAARLFSIRGLPEDKIPKKLLAKGLKSSSASTSDSATTAVVHGLAYQCAEAECVVEKLCELLAEVIDNTQAQVEKKQTRTIEELEAEQEEEEAGVDDVPMEEEDSDDETPFYNPLNLPLGWDGKPIPYWLYKLHGLGVEYKCEICGNYSYWGRRAFDRHFQEWRHAHGMRCLKIPNTKHFHDITLIEDAINLYEKLKDTLETDEWDPGQEEEFEDSEGNVLKKRVFEDLARQGLL